MKHQPVLLKEVLELLDPRPGDFIIDGTVDGGGHAEAIAERIGPRGKLFGLDWDATMLANAENRLGHQKNIRLLHASYADLPAILRNEKSEKADGLLLDLGFSSEQLESSGRGFSFRSASQSEPLLMTYDDMRRPVWKILREEGEEALANIIYEFGGERRSRRIAKAIKERERQGPIMTSGALAEAVRNALPRSYEHGRIDPATRTFQAFRIYANGELENVRMVLEGVREVVKPGGRVVIISFHSLEDRIVKQYFSKLAKEGAGELLTKKPKMATREEILANPRSRSAKLRAIQLR